MAFSVGLYLNLAGTATRGPFTAVCSALELVHRLADARGHNGQYTGGIELSNNILLKR